MKTTTRGFTLIEVMVASAIGVAAVLAAFAIGQYQIRAHRTQSETAGMQHSTEIVFESMARDLQRAGFGTTFYAGAPNGAFAGRLAFGNRGVPALRFANNIFAGGPRRGSDAVSLIRLESAVTSIPRVGGQPITGVPGVDQPYQVADARLLEPCANDPDGGLVLVSDYAHRSEPSSMLLAVGAFDDTPTAPGPIDFVDAFNIDPADNARVNANPAASLVDPDGMGSGALVVCARPVTYWIDPQARLRMWRATANLPGGSRIARGAWGAVPIDPDNDVVLAEGVEELQFAYLMSNEAGALANQWVHADPEVDTSLETLTALSEIRAVRLVALLRTPRTVQDAPRSSLPPAANDRALAGLTAEVGCDNPTLCFDPRYNRRMVVIQSELRNMRLFDLMSDPSRTTATIRSFIL